MKIITMILDIATAFLYVLEGEGRLLRMSVVHRGWAVGFMVMAFLLGLTAAGFLVLGMYQYLASQTSPAAAALLVSLLAFLLSLIFAGIAKWRTI